MAAAVVALKTGSDQRLRFSAASFSLSPGRAQRSALNAALRARAAGVVRSSRIDLRRRAATSGFRHDRLMAHGREHVTRLDLRPRLNSSWQITQTSAPAGSK